MIEVQVLGHQRISSRIEKAIGWEELACLVARLDELQLLRFEGAEVDPRRFAACRPDEDQEPLPIGQELRPTMEDVSPTRIELRRRNGSAARSRNARQDARRNSSKEDHPFPAPRASAPEPRVAENL